MNKLQEKMWEDWIMSLLRKKNSKCTEESCLKNENSEANIDNKGTRNKNKKSAMILGGILLCGVVSGVFYYFNIYEGEFGVELVKDTFELGEEQNLVRSLKLNSKNISNVSIVNDGGFSTGILGDYIVTFDVVNNRGNHKEISFEYHVTDTIAPTVKLDKTEVYLAKGVKFDIEQYAIPEDLSETFLKYEGEFDNNIEGEYNIEIYAEDISGNISEKQPMHIIVEDRSNCDIRQAKFGDTREVVKRYEEAELLYEGDEGLLYRTTLNGMDADLLYQFNSENQLTIAGYLMGDSFINKDLYITYYDELVGLLTDKYGKPDDSQKRKSDGMGLSAGTALWLGEYARQDEWYLDKMNIRTLLQSEKSNEILFNCVYFSNVFKSDESSNNDL